MISKLKAIWSVISACSNWVSGHKEQLENNAGLLIVLAVCISFLCGFGSLSSQYFMYDRVESLEYKTEVLASSDTVLYNQQQIGIDSLWRQHVIDSIRVTLQKDEIIKKLGEIQDEQRQQRERIDRIYESQFRRP